jgi:hypothetical protein
MHSSGPIGLEGCCAQRRTVVSRAQASCIRIGELFSDARHTDIDTRNGQEMEEGSGSGSGSRSIDEVSKYLFCIDQVSTSPATREGELATLDY